MTPRFRPNPDLQTGIRANRALLAAALRHNPPDRRTVDDSRQAHQESGAA